MAIKNNNKIGKKLHIACSLTTYSLNNTCAHLLFNALKYSYLTSDLRAEVDLHDVPVLQHRVVAAVGGVVRRHVVDRAARGERDARLAEMNSSLQEGIIYHTHFYFYAYILYGESLR